MKKDEIIELSRRLHRARRCAGARSTSEVSRVKRASDGGYDDRRPRKAISPPIRSWSPRAAITRRSCRAWPSACPQAIVQIPFVGSIAIPQSLPEGAVLVVGSGQSGAQIAEDLHLAGRKVDLAVGEAPRCARFYRGRDVVDWLADMRYYDMPVEKHPLREGVRDNTNHYVTGRDGGRDIDLRKFAAEGMELYGRLDDLRDGATPFRTDARAPISTQRGRYVQRHQREHRRLHRKAWHRRAAGGVYEPVWRAGRRTHDARSPTPAAFRSIIWCIGFTAGLQLARRAGVQRSRLSGAYRVALRRSTVCISSACRGCIHGARGASLASRVMRSSSYRLFERKCASVSR